MIQGRQKYIKEKNNKFESERNPTYPTKGWLGVWGMFQWYTGRIFD